ncbi:MAG: nuclear transport factor 2 family protein [Archangium sp.]
MRVAPKVAPDAVKSSNAPVKADAAAEAAPVNTTWAPKAGAVSAPAASTVKSPRDVVTDFYAAFVKQDTKRMEQLYSKDVKFQDAIFKYADREGTMGMWNKILRDPKSKFTFELKSVEGDVVTGHWKADYELFGRKVHNEIDTRMVVKDGKIVEHRDSFDWDTWAKQALPAGGLFTMTPFEQLAKGALRLFVG